MPQLAKYLNKYFTKEDIYMVNKYMKQCSISLVIKKICTKTTMSYKKNFIKIAKAKKTVASVDENTA